MPSIIHKRSSVAGKVPTTTQLALGELAVNTTDGKVYMKKSVDGVESIIEVTGTSSSGGSVVMTADANTAILYASL